MRALQRYWTGLCAAAVVASMGGPAAAVTVDWRQGSGNTGQHFTTSTDVFGSDSIELGLRAIQRNVGTITPSGNVYVAQRGPSSQPTRAWWNFDIHVDYDGVIADLDSLTLGISTIGGSTPSAPTFDLLLLRPFIDCHVLNCANPAPTNPDALGDEDPAHFYQASQNPTFAPWFSSFNMFQPGQYFFTLTATEGSDSVSTRIEVNVVPEPSSLALFGVALAALGFGLRRRRP